MRTQFHRPALWLVALVAATSVSLSSGSAQAADYSKSILTLNHLKNATYQVRDLACGYTDVHLINGECDHSNMQATFGRAVFGTFSKQKTTCAVVHLAYKVEGLGWMQQLLFVRAEGSKLVQIAEYGLDDRDELKSMEMRNGQLAVTTSKNKIIMIGLSDTKQGCLLKATEWQKDPTTQQLKPYVDMTPYLSAIEERIGKCWAPTNRDRGEHVTVAVTIQPSGEVKETYISDSSEVPAADQAALDAIADAVPFPPLPQGSTESLAVHLEFQADVSAAQ